MRVTRTILIFTAFLVLVSCAGKGEPASPKKTFETYMKAVAKKDITTMKLLLSAESIKMHEQEAKSQGLTVDDIVKQETLFSEGQKVVKVRDEKIDGGRATLEYQVSSDQDRWETIPFLFEDGQWKIDKKGYLDRMMQEIEQHNQQIDNMINEGRQPQ
jgi:hypothetical protein